jgi:hypothetical protein
MYREEKHLAEYNLEMETLKYGLRLIIIHRHKDEIVVLGYNAVWTRR